MKRRSGLRATEPAPRLTRHSRVLLVAAVLACCTTASRALALCADDAVLVGGTLCVDKYEASVWSRPPGGPDRGTQYLIFSDYPCVENGQGCDQMYAASLPGVLPSTGATWLQAQQACANVGKRLPTNAEWQLAATGTPDAGIDDGSTTCHTEAGFPLQVAATGSRSSCVSRWGAFDMVGNLLEMVAEWVPGTQICTGWGSVSDATMCFAGAETNQTNPGSLQRGGSHGDGASAGPLYIIVGPPHAGNVFYGFRCVRSAS